MQAGRTGPAAAVSKLEALAVRLRAGGWAVMLHAADEGRQPALDVTNPHAPRLSDRVLTGMDADGQWWLW